MTLLLRADDLLSKQISFLLEKYSSRACAQIRIPNMDPSKFIKNKVLAITMEKLRHGGFISVLLIQAIIIVKHFFGLAASLFLYQLAVFYLITPAFSEKGTHPPLPPAICCIALFILLYFFFNLNYSMAFTRW